MSDDKNWPFNNDKQVFGMKLPYYLGWAAGEENYPKRLFLPPIQRGFVWKPWQIAQLWDSLLRGMPIGSLMVSKLSKDQKALNPKTHETVAVDNEAMGLLDGQQRTLAMLLIWPDSQSSQYCLWVDLGEEGQAGSPFELRITTKTQPFGFQRFSHSRLSLHDRKEARKQYDETHSEYMNTPDYKLFELGDNKPRPWKANKNSVFFVPLKDVWQEFRKVNERNKFNEHFKELFKHNAVDESRLDRLFEAFNRLESLEVPLVLIPETIPLPIVKTQKWVVFGGLAC